MKLIPSCGTKDVSAVCDQCGERDVTVVALTAESPVGDMNASATFCRACLVRALAMIDGAGR